MRKDELRAVFPGAVAESGLMVDFTGAEPRNSSGEFLNVVGCFGKSIDKSFHRRFRILKQLRTIKFIAPAVAVAGFGWASLKRIY
jgi:hypothetical protein